MYWRVSWESPMFQCEVFRIGQEMLQFNYTNMTSDDARAIGAQYTPKVQAFFIIMRELD